jgi:hypothetical protein
MDGVAASDLRNQLIEQHLQYCNLLARGLGRKHPCNRDGVRSEAYVGLCQAVDVILLKQINPELHKGVIATIVRRVVMEFIPTDRVISVTRNLQRTNSKLPKTEPLVREPKKCVCGLPHDVEIREIIEAAKLTGPELFVTAKCLAGYRDVEISNMMSCSPSWVSRVRRAAGQKIKEIIYG